MQNHVKQIVLSGLHIPQEMPLQLPHIHLHSCILLRTNSCQNLLQPPNILLRHDNGERPPIEHLLKREHKVVGYDHRNALVVDGLHDPGAVHFVAHGADAKLARLHVLDVRHPAGNLRRQGFVYLHVRIPAPPKLEQDGPHSAMHVPREEGQEGSLCRRVPSRASLGPFGSPYVGLWKGDILSSDKDPLRNIGVAHRFDCVLPQFLMQPSRISCLHRRGKVHQTYEQCIYG